MDPVQAGKTRDSESNQRSASEGRAPAREEHQRGKSTVAPEPLDPAVSEHWEDSLPRTSEQREAARIKSRHFRLLSQPASSEKSRENIVWKNKTKYKHLPIRHEL